MIAATVEKTKEGKYEVADQATGEVYGLVDAKGDAVDLAREKTGDLDVAILASDD